MSKKLVIFISVFSILTFISSIICTSLVYLNESARTSINSKEVLANSNNFKSISITYDTKNEIDINDLNQNKTIRKNFKITNHNSDDLTLSLKWMNVDTDWYQIDETRGERKNVFNYSISCNGTNIIENKEMPKNNEENTSQIKLKSNKENECYIDINFQTENDIYMTPKRFKGTFKIILDK